MDLLAEAREGSSGSHFREALDRAGLLDSSDLHVLFRTDAWAFSWPEIIKAAAEKCDDVQAKLLVIDTFAPFGSGLYTGMLG